MEKYAEYFAAGGLQALLFDYRGFGEIHVKAEGERRC